MWLLHNSRWGPDRKNESERETGNVRDIRFYSKAKRGFLFLLRRKIYSAIDGDFNARIKQTNSLSTELAKRTRLHIKQSVISQQYNHLNNEFILCNREV